MKFADKIVRAREASGLTQQKLAEAVGVSQRTIASYESEGAMPRRRTMEKLADALKVSVKYLSDEKCTNQFEDIEKDTYVEEARALYGYRGAKEIDTLLDENKALFAGGELSDEQKDKFFQAIMSAYLMSKEAAKEKFGKKQ